MIRNIKIFCKTLFKNSFSQFLADVDAVLNYISDLKELLSEI